MSRSGHADLTERRQHDRTGGLGIENVQALSTQLLKNRIVAQMHGVDLCAELLELVFPHPLDLFTGGGRRGAGL